MFWLAYGESNYCTNATCIIAARAWFKIKLNARPRKEAKASVVQLFEVHFAREQCNEKFFPFWRCFIYNFSTVFIVSDDEVIPGALGIGASVLNGSSQHPAPH